MTPPSESSAGALLLTNIECPHIVTFLIYTWYKHKIWCNSINDKPLQPAFLVRPMHVHRNTQKIHTRKAASFYQHIIGKSRGVGVKRLFILRPPPLFSDPCLVIINERPLMQVKITSPLMKGKWRLSHCEVQGLLPHWRAKKNPNCSDSADGNFQEQEANVFLDVNAPISTLSEKNYETLCFYKAT